MHPTFPIESLESRRLLRDIATVDPTDARGANQFGETLYVNGGSGADTIRITSTDSGKNIAVSLTDDHTDASAASGLFVFPASDVAKLFVRANNGADTVDIHINVPATLIGGAGSDTIYGGDGANEIHTESGAYDIVVGGEGPDLIYGGGGKLNRLVGRGGDDTIFGGIGRDVIHGGDGNDELHGEVGDDFLIGDNGNDRLYGGSGNDKLDGGADGDRLYGNRGDDTLLGGSGVDFLDGGRGADVGSPKKKREEHKSIEWFVAIIQ